MFFWNSLAFFYDPAYVGNLISGSSAFSKSSLNIWRFLVHLLLKPSLKDCEHSLASMWNECNGTVIWTFFGIGMKTDLFQSCGHYWVFQICYHIECSTLTALSFRIYRLVNELMHVCNFSGRFCSLFWLKVEVYVLNLEVQRDVLGMRIVQFLFTFILRILLFVRSIY